MASPGLRVGVAMNITRFPTSVGVGKVWNRTLRRLVDLGIRVDFLEPGTLRARGGRPDVWLFDGHFGPIPVDEPTVALLQEAPWRDPGLAAMLSPAWVSRLGPPSDESARQATLVLTPSQSSAGQIATSAGVDGSRIRVVPYGVDPLVFHPARAAGGRALVAEAGAGRRPYLLAVATTLPRKNLDSLRQAFAHLVGRGLPHVLVMVLSPSPDVTDGTSRDSVAHTRIDGHPGRSAVLRDLPEISLAAVMSGAAAYCQPSLMEGFGLTTLEAMACGVPVVVSDRGSLPEVVGDCGCVVEPTAAALEASLDAVLTGAAGTEGMGAAGRARSACFTWEATALGWSAALEEAACRGRQGRTAQEGRRQGRGHGPAAASTAPGPGSGDPTWIRASSGRPEPARGLPSRRG